MPAGRLIDLAPTTVRKPQAEDLPNFVRPKMVQSQVESPVHLDRFRRADERTRTAYPCSSRVCGQWFLSLAGVCNYRIDKRVFCSRVRVKLGSERGESQAPLYLCKSD